MYYDFPGKRSYTSDKCLSGATVYTRNHYAINSDHNYVRQHSDHNDYDNDNVINGFINNNNYVRVY
ncbi:MAG: hypothetical protein QW533_05695 [Thermoplasmata archaeon]